MSRITFKRMSPEESRIFSDGDYVGDVYAHDDILDAGARHFVIWLDEDPRGWVRVHDRSRIRAVAEARVASHPLWR